MLGVQYGRLTRVDVYAAQSLLVNAPQKVAPANQVFYYVSVGSCAHGLYALFADLYQTVVSAHPCLSPRIGDDGVGSVPIPLGGLAVDSAVQSLGRCYPQPVLVYCYLVDGRAGVVYEFGLWLPVVRLQQVYASVGAYP